MRRSAFTWTGASGTDDDWTTNENWTSSGCPSCHPHTCSDDATISTALGASVDLVSDITVDDLTLVNDVDFGASSAVTLTVDSLTIVGPCDIDFDSTVRLRTQTCP